MLEPEPETKILMPGAGARNLSSGSTALVKNVVYFECSVVRVCYEQVCFEWTPSSYSIFFSFFISVIGCSPALVALGRRPVRIPFVYP